VRCKAQIQRAVAAAGQLLPALECSLEAVRSGTPATLNVMTQGRR
jgi:hypothetical protein